MSTAFFLLRWVVASYAAIHFSLDPQDGGPVLGVIILYPLLDALAREGAKAWRLERELRRREKGLPEKGALSFTKEENPIFFTQYNRLRKKVGPAAAKRLAAVAAGYKLVD